MTDRTNLLRHCQAIGSALKGPTPDADHVDGHGQPCGHCPGCRPRLRTAVNLEESDLRPVQCERCGVEVLGQGVHGEDRLGCDVCAELTLEWAPVKGDDYVCGVIVPNKDGPITVCDGRARDYWPDITTMTLLSEMRYMARASGLPRKETRQALRADARDRDRRRADLARLRRLDRQQ